MPAMIVLGDKTDHGGEVIEASGVTDTHGKQIARIGDKVVCPKKGHSNAVIVTGDLTMVIDGKAAAYHGCKTSCGATLISSQMVTSVEFGGGSGASGAIAGTAALTQASTSGATDKSSADGAAGTSAAASSALSSDVYDDQFELRDDAGVLLADTPYTVRLPSGELVHGATDEQGRTLRYQTDDAQTLEIFLGHI
jgi:uncharacterized Zn-binding protein involved in type VI secretion